MNLQLILRNIFVILFSLCVQSVVFAASPSASNKGLTEQKILSFLKAQDDAFLRGDAATLISTLADNFTRTIEQPGQEVSKLTRGEYEVALIKDMKNLAQFSNVQINHEDRKIHISQDGQSASVTAKNIGKFTVGDKNVTIISLSTSTDTLGLQGGKIVTTSSVESDISQEVTPTKSSALMRQEERERDAIYCMKGDDCEDQWAQALAFARRQFSRELFFESDTLIRSTDPAFEQAEREDGARPKVSKMIIRRTHLGGGKYEIEFDFKCGTACVTSTSEEMRKNFVSVMKYFQKHRPNAVTSPSAVSAQPSALASGSVSIDDQLKQLQDLHDKKIITDQEYKAMRKKALGL